MNGPFDISDTMFLTFHNWFWMAVALAAGIWVGWQTAASRAARRARMRRQAA